LAINVNPPNIDTQAAMTGNELDHAACGATETDTAPIVNPEPIDTAPIPLTILAASTFPWSLISINICSIFIFLSWPVDNDMMNAFYTT